MFKNTKLALALGLVTSFAATNASAAVDVADAVAEMSGALVPIGLLGGAALLVTVVIKVYKRVRGAA